MNNEIPPARFAFIGTGIVSHLHARAVLGNPRAILAGAYNRTPSKLEKFAAAYGCKSYRSVDEILTDADVDAVVILTGVESHVEFATRAMQSGKHVILEKPVASSIAEIETLQHISEETGRICMPVHNYIYAPELLRARRLVAEGRLGDVASLWVLYNIFHSEDLGKIYGGVLRAVCVHHAYSLLFLLGRPSAVSATKGCLHYKEITSEDQVMITARMETGALAHLWASFAASDHTSDPWTVLYKILGTKGGFTYSWNNALFEDDGGPAWGINSYVESFAGLIDYFVSDCWSQGRPPLSTLQDAADALRIVEAAENSILQEGKSIPIQWP